MVTKKRKNRKNIQEKICQNNRIYRYTAGSIKYKTVIKLVRKNGADCMAERTSNSRI